MTRKVGPGRPPDGTRFEKGKSGNPKGRPKGSGAAPVSAFDVVIHRTIAVTQNGKPRELSVEEALQQKTLQRAFGGNRADGREILKMIQKREEWIAQHPPKQKPIPSRVENVDPDNADEALIVLGIAKSNPDWNASAKGGVPRLLLQDWAVKAALRADPAAAAGPVECT